MAQAGRSQQATDQALYNAQYSAWAAANMKNSGSDSKTKDMMIMSQMMQAQANLAAASANKKTADKDDKKESKIEMPKLELTQFKAPEPPAPDKMVVDLKALGAPTVFNAIKAPPIPNVSSQAALEIISGFKPIAKVVATPAPSATPAPAPVPVVEGKSRIPASINPEPGTPVEGSRIGYANTAPVAAQRGFAGGAPVVGALAPGAGNTYAGGGQSDPHPTEGGRVRGRGAIEDAGESSGGSGGGESRGGGGSRDDGYSDILSELFGLKVPPAAGVGEELFMPEKEENPGTNIFEYATYRYKNVTAKTSSKRKR